MKYLFILSVLLLSSNYSLAGSINCGFVTVKSLYVQADRNDNGFHSNKLIIIMGDEKTSECNDFTFAYIENTHDAYDGILSLALAAKLSGSKLRIQVENTPIEALSRRIAWVNL